MSAGDEEVSLRDLAVRAVMQDAARKGRPLSEQTALRLVGLRASEDAYWRIIDKLSAYGGERPDE